LGIGIQEFSIFRDALLRRYHGVIISGGVSAVHNSGPKFFGSNGGDYYVHCILGGIFPCILVCCPGVILEFYSRMDLPDNHLSIIVQVSGRLV
jgi:hypothetical protein